MRKIIQKLKGDPKLRNDVMTIAKTGIENILDPETLKLIPGIKIFYYTYDAFTNINNQLFLMKGESFVKGFRSGTESEESIVAFRKRMGEKEISAILDYLNALSSEEKTKILGKLCVSWIDGFFTNKEYFLLREYLLVYRDLDKEKLIEMYKGIHCADGIKSHLYKYEANNLMNYNLAVNKGVTAASLNSGNIIKVEITELGKKFYEHCLKDC